MAERKYHDADGDGISLDVLCRRAPEWAANVIRSHEGAINKLESSLSASQDECRRLRDVIAGVSDHISMVLDNTSDLDGELRERFTNMRKNLLASLTPSVKSKGE